MLGTIILLRNFKKQTSSYTMQVAINQPGNFELGKNENLFGFQSKKSAKRWKFEGNYI